MIFGQDGLHMLYNILIAPVGLPQQARPSPATSKPLPPAGATQAAARGVDAGGFEGGGRGEDDAKASKEAARKEAKRLAFMEDRARIQVFSGSAIDTTWWSAAQNLCSVRPVWSAFDIHGQLHSQLGAWLVLSLNTREISYGLRIPSLSWMRTRADTTDT